MPDQATTRPPTLSRKTTRVAVGTPRISPTKNDRVSHLGLTLPARPTMSRLRFAKPGMKAFDPEADYNYDSTDDESDDKNKRSKSTEGGINNGAAAYEKLCKRFGKLAISNVMKQFGRSSISLEGMNLSKRELKAFFIALVECYVNKDFLKEADQGSDLLHLEMKGNKLGVKEAGYLTQFVSAHKPLTVVNLSGCNLCSKGLRKLANFTRINKSVKTLDLSDNDIGDANTHHIADIIENGENITELLLSRNKIGDSAALIGEALANNDTLLYLDLSWNHIRGPGAINFCKGFKGNQALQTLILAWNGFGFEGCAGMKLVLADNTTLQTLDLSNNRIHPPALFELMKGLEKNKTIGSLRLGYNPITASMSSILISSIQKAKESNLKELDLAGIVVDKDFEGIVKEIQENRIFIVRYDTSLPLNKGQVTKIDPKNIFNIDPVRILFFMKEHLRTIDLFLKVDKDGNNTLSKDEMKYAFEMEGFPISDMALGQVMGYLDTNKDGEVDLLEFYDGERRLKRQLIKEKEENLMATKEEDQKFSQAFTAAPVKPPPKKLPPLNGPKLA